MADMRLSWPAPAGAWGARWSRPSPKPRASRSPARSSSRARRCIGHDAGELAGLGKNGIALTDDAEPLLGERRRRDRFHRAGRDRRPCRARRRSAASSMSSAPPASRTTTRRRSQRPRSKAVIVKSGNMSLGVNLLAALVKRVAKTLDDDFDIEILEMHHNKKIDAPSGTALLLGRAAAEGRGIDLDKHSRARARRPYRRAQGRRYRLCDAARRHRGRRSQRDLRRPGRAHRACAQGRGPHDLRARRAQGGAVGARPEARALFAWPTCSGLKDLLSLIASRSRSSGMTK